MSARNKEKGEHKKEREGRKVVERRVQRIKCVPFAHTKRDSPMMAKMRV